MVELDQPLHLASAGVEVVLEHPDRNIHVDIFGVIAGKVERAGHNPRSVNAMFDLKLVENAGHTRASLDLPAAIQELRTAEYREARGRPIAGQLATIEPRAFDCPGR